MLYMLQYLVKMGVAGVNVISISSYLLYGHGSDSDKNLKSGNGLKVTNHHGNHCLFFA